MDDNIVHEERQDSVLGWSVVAVIGRTGTHTPFWAWIYQTNYLTDGFGLVSLVQPTFDLTIVQHRSSMWSGRSL
jgi:hypothetical protein